MAESPEFPLPEGYAFLKDEKLVEEAKKYGLSYMQLTATASAAVDAKKGPYSKFRVGAALLTKVRLETPMIRIAPELPSTTSLYLNENSQTPQEQICYLSNRAPEHEQQIVTGANIENCSYPVGTCAERAALAVAIGQGHLPVTQEQQANEASPSPLKGRGISAIAVAADSEDPCSPCGMCRQFLRELVPASVPVFMFSRRGTWAVLTVKELLPLSFGPGDLLSAPVGGK